MWLFKKRIIEVEAEVIASYNLFEISSAMLIKQSRLNMVRLHQGARELRLNCDAMNRKKNQTPAVKINIISRAVRSFLGINDLDKKIDALQNQLINHANIIASSLKETGDLAVGSNDIYSACLIKADDILKGVSSHDKYGKELLELSAASIVEMGSRFKESPPQEIDNNNSEG